MRTTPFLLSALALAACAPHHVVGPGDHVRIRAADGARIEGQLLEVTGDSLRLQGAERVEVLPAAGVDGLRIRRDNPTWRRVVSGIVAGLGVGLMIYRVSDHPGTWQWDEGITMGASGLLIGHSAYDAAQDSLWVPARLPEAP